MENKYMNYKEVYNFFFSKITAKGLRFAEKELTALEDKGVVHPVTAKNVRNEFYSIY